MAERKWTTEQLQCIHDNGGTLLVSAAAGSGKTSVLVQRILQKITDPVNPIDIDRLLVVTFTKAAAAEMKQRIAAQLTALIAQHPHDLRLPKQQLALARASISTVDGFCSSLIRENAHLLNISPQFKVAETPQLLLLRQETLQETLDEFYRAQNPAFIELAAMLSNGKNDSLLMSTVERVFDFIQSHPYPEDWLSRMEDIYDDTLPVKDTVWGRIIIEQIRSTLEKCIQLCHAACSLCVKDAALTNKYLPSLQTDAAILETLYQQTTVNLQWDTLFASLSGFSLTAVLPVRHCSDEPAKQRIASLRDSVRSLMDSLRKLHCGTEAQCQQDLRNSKALITVLYSIVRRFSVLFAEKKRSKGIVDFNDIEHHALSLLTEPDGMGGYRPTFLARELSQQYDEIMVDEYQDTNATQDALFSALSRDESNLFYVGDVKQSIYSFRQAMPELFVRRRTQYATYDGVTYPSTITLGNNFRSRAEVTDSVNFLFRQLMTEETGGIFYDDREALVCSAVYPPCDGHETELLLINGEQVNETAIEKDVAEARVIAARIRDMVGTLSITDGDHQRPANYGDICILLRSKKSHAGAYRDELERIGIPVQMESDSAFFETAEIRLALSLLRCIDNPLLDISLAAVMMSPLYGFTPDDMALIRGYHPSSSLFASVQVAKRQQEQPKLSNRCRQLLDDLARFRLLASSVPVDALLRRLYVETALPELMSTRVGGTLRRDNLQLLHDYSSRFEQNGFRGLSAFIHFIDRLQEQQADLSVTASLSTNTDEAVRIMSIHSSKGLEFPVVFLAGLGNQFNRESLNSDLLLHPDLGAGIRLRDTQTFNRYVTLPHRGLSLAIRNNTRAEELRVLYVALTRAREKLCLVMTQNKPEKLLETLAGSLNGTDALSPFTVFNAASMGEWILAALLRHPSAHELRHQIDREDLPLLVSEKPCIIRFCDIPEEETKQSCTVTQCQPDEQLLEEIHQRTSYRYPYDTLSHIPAKMAASSVSHDTVHSEFLARSCPAFLSNSGLTPAERGTALHTFMQFASYQAASDNADGERWRLAEKGFLSQKQAEALDIQSINTFFNSPLYERIARSPRCFREYHFTCQQPASDIAPFVELDTEDFVVLQGIADCVFEEDGQLVIVDYKTDRIRTPEELVERYRCQLDIYRNAISKALEMPVKECILYSFTLNRSITIP